MPWIQKIISQFNIFWIVITLLAYINPCVNPQDFKYLGIIGVIFPYLIFGHVLFVAYWLFKKKKTILYSLITLLIGNVPISNLIPFNQSKEIKSSQKISIVSYNLALGSAFKNEKLKKKKFRTLLKKFRDNDLLLIQEYSKDLKELFENAFPDHQLYTSKVKSIAIFSKHKIIDQGEIKLSNNINTCIWVDIRHELDTIRIYNAHLQSNRISKDATEIIKDPKLNDKKSWNKIKNILSRFMNYQEIRVNQIEQIITHKNKISHPAIIAGDFNETPNSYLYAKISDEMTDSFIDKGRGIGATFAGTLPFLRIDYIFCDSNFKILSSKVLSGEYSDHYPLQSLIKLK